MTLRIRQLFLAFGFCMLLWPARAQYTLSLSSVSGHPGDTVEVALSLAGGAEAAALQTEIALDNSLTYVAGSCQMSSRSNGHQVSAGMVNGHLNIVAFAFPSAPFQESGGVLLTFKLKLGNIPATYTLHPVNTVISTVAGNELTISSLSDGSVTLLSPKLQINATSVNFGHIPIRSIYTKSFSITNIGNEPLVISGFQFADEEFSVPGFTGLTVAAGRNANITITYTPVMAGQVNSNVRLLSNSVGYIPPLSLLADPYSVNELHLLNASGHSDSIVEVVLTMNNMDAISGLQCQFQLPDVLEFVPNSFVVNAQRAQDHEASSGMLDGVLNLVAFSPSNKGFLGEGGPVASFKVKLTGRYGTYALNPLNPILSNVTGDNVLSGSYSGRVQIYSPRISTSSSVQMGITSVVETAEQILLVRNQGNAPLTISNVVFSQSGFFIREELPLTISNSASLHVCYVGTGDGPFNAIMQIYNDDPDNGLVNVAVSGTRYEPNTISLSTVAETPFYQVVPVSVEVDNYSDIAAVQFDFSYPHRDYTVAASDFVASARASQHSVLAMPLNDSTFRVLVYAFPNQAIQGHEGALMTINLHPKGRQAIGYHTCRLGEVTLSDMKAKNRLTDSAMTATFKAVAVLVEKPTEEVSLCEDEMPYIWHGKTITGAGDYADTLLCSLAADTLYSLHLTVLYATHNIETETTCDSLTWHGVKYTKSGTYLYDYTNAAGCPSMDTLHLTVHYGTHNVETETACDSLTWHGVKYTKSGVYMYDYTNADGCPSTDTLHLTVHYGTHNVETETTCDSLTWHGVKYTKSGVYVYDYNNADDCPSTDTLHLTVHYGTHNVETVTACDSMTWHGEKYTESGVYTYDYTNADGCPSTDTLHLTVHYGTHNSETETACDSLTWHGVKYTESGVYTYDYNNADGCPSTDTLYLTVHYSTHNVETETACDSLTWHGVKYTKSGVYTYDYNNTDGCPSTDTLHLTVHYGTHKVETVTACDSLLTWHGKKYTESGVYTYDYTNADGCPSTDTLHLTFGSTYYQKMNDEICESELPYVIYGEEINESGDYQFRIQSEEACDTVVDLHLTVLYGTYNAETEIVCESIIWHGKKYTKSGVYTYDYTNAAGCPSTDTLHLTVHYGTHNSETETVCDSYLWHGVKYTQSGMYLYDYENENGCPSTDTLHLTVNPSYFYSELDSVYSNEVYVWQNHDVQIGKLSPGTYSFYDSLATQSGCDSVYQLTLEVLPVNELLLSVQSGYIDEDVKISVELWNQTPMTAVQFDVVLPVEYELQNADVVKSSRCANHSFYVNKLNASTWRVMLFSMSNQTIVGDQGEIVSITLHPMSNTPVGTYEVKLTNLVLSPLSGTTMHIDAGDRIMFTPQCKETQAFDNLTLCQGDLPYYYAPGDTTFREAQSAIVVFHLHDQHGCDSVLTLDLKVNIPDHQAYTIVECDSFVWNNHTYTQSGDYTFVKMDANGCEQVDTLHLTIHHSAESEFSVECSDSCYVWNGISYCESGDYVQVLKTEYQCDSVVTLHLTITVGVDQYAKSHKIIAFPNPTNQAVSIRIDNPNVRIAHIALFDNVGKRIRTEQYNQGEQSILLDLSTLPSGLYFVRLYDKNGYIGTAKIVKQ